MLVGQNLGPFIIDKELGAGAMGAVYRARYEKTGQVVAVKVMAPGLGDNNPSAVARFEREAAILKQLHHPNIVRLFGVGKFQGTRYYAMEYIQGESLDRIMNRRGRMTWEEVVELGQQLCSALQHAHEAGIVHRDLKPSNLMILTDGTLKLTDFGIAKDLDVTALTSANCTVGTASYMSPEQCKGERDITYKSDLYSLGVVFYELITGKKPFNAENAMDMFLLHVQGTFERPSRIVLDMPVWMDNLICQMLEKKPEQRPLSAKMVSEVLGSIQEKVEAQQSAGVDAVRARMIDRPRGTRNPDEGDKEVARALMTGKKGRRKPKKAGGAPRWLTTGPLGLVVVIAGAGCLLAALAGVLYFVTRPPDPETLYTRAKKLMDSPSFDDHEKAYAPDGPIRAYLANYAARPGDETKQILAWKKQCDVEECEDSLQKLLKRMRKGFNSEPASDAERDAKQAALADERGELVEAQHLWQDMTNKYGPSSGQDHWGILAANHLAVDQAVLDHEKKLANDLREFHQSGREPRLEGLDQDAYKALRFQYLGDWASVKSLYNRMKDDAAKSPDARFWDVYLSRQLKGIDERLPKKDDPNYRRDLVTRAVETCEQAMAADPPDRPTARAVASHVIDLYGDDPDLKPLVDRARKVRKEVAGKPAAP
jgi:serine/threonine-protein kinase